MELNQAYIPFDLIREVIEKDQRPVTLSTGVKERIQQCKKLS
jgi:hypothetical protein